MIRRWPWVVVWGLLCTGAAQAAQKAEPKILNVPQSWLFVALASALIGVLLLAADTADRFAQSETKPIRRLLALATRGGLLGAVVIGYALLASWSLQAAAAAANLSESVAIPLVGILGVFIRPLLPRYLKGVEGVTDRVFGRVGS